MNDTSKEIQEKFEKELLDLSPADRLEMACSQFEFARDLVKESILQDAPDISKDELAKRVFLRFYGNDFSPTEIEKVLKSFGWC